MYFLFSIYFSIYLEFKKRNFELCAFQRDRRREVTFVSRGILCTVSE